MKSSRRVILTQGVVCENLRKPVFLFKFEQNQPLAGEQKQRNKALVSRGTCFYFLQIFSKSIYSSFIRLQKIHYNFEQNQRVWPTAKEDNTKQNIKAEKLYNGKTCGIKRQMLFLSSHFIKFVYFCNSHFLECCPIFVVPQSP